MIAGVAYSAEPQLTPDPNNLTDGVPGNVNLAHGGDTAGAVKSGDVGLEEITQNPILARFYTEYTGLDWVRVVWSGAFRVGDLENLDTKVYYPVSKLDTENLETMWNAYKDGRARLAQKTGNGWLVVEPTFLTRRTSAAQSSSDGKLWNWNDSAEANKDGASWSAISPDTTDIRPIIAADHWAKFVIDAPNESINISSHELEPNSCVDKFNDTSESVKIKSVNRWLEVVNCTYPNFDDLGFAAPYNIFENKSNRPFEKIVTWRPEDQIEFAN